MNRYKIEIKDLNENLVKLIDKNFPCFAHKDYIIWQGIGKELLLQCKENGELYGNIFNIDLNKNTYKIHN